MYIIPIKIGDKMRIYITIIPLLILIILSPITSSFTTREYIQQNDYENAKCIIYRDIYSEEIIKDCNRDPQYAPPQYFPLTILFYNDEYYAPQDYSLSKITGGEAALFKEVKTDSTILAPLIIIDTNAIYIEKVNIEGQSKWSVIAEIKSYMSHSK